MVSSARKNKSRKQKRARSSQVHSQHANVQSVQLNPSARDFVPTCYSQDPICVLGPPIPPPIPAPIPPPIPAPLPPPIMHMPGITPIIVPLHPRTVEAMMHYCPVVYPDRHGRPGTVFFVRWNQVPPNAVPVPIPDGNGGYKTHFFIA